MIFRLIAACLLIMLAGISIPAGPSYAQSVRYSWQDVMMNAANAAATSSAVPADAYDPFAFRDPTRPPQGPQMSADYFNMQAQSLLESNVIDPAIGGMTDRFFDRDRTLSPNASIEERLRYEATSIVGESFRQHTLNGANVMRILRALNSEGVGGDAEGETTDQVLRDILEQTKYGLANSVIRRGMDQLKVLPYAGFRNLEGEFILRKGQSPEFALTTVQPVYESLDLRHSVFAQASVRTQDDLRTGNLGLAYRHMTADERLLLGVNAFLDHEWTNDHTRMSIGVDAATSLLSFYANHYMPLSGWRDMGQGMEQRAMSGWDAGITGRFETAPEVQLAARIYQWNRDGEQENLRGFEAGMDYSPVQAFKAGFRAGRDNDEGFTLTGTLGLRWLFGVDKDEQLKKPEYKRGSVVDRRFDKVQRENRILTQDRQKDSLTATVISTTGGNSARFPDGNVVSLSVGMTLPFASVITVENTPGAQAVLSFGSGATLVIGQDTVLTLNFDSITLAQGIMRFISGGTDVTINVPGGVITLTGTDVDVRTQGMRTTVRVRDGGILAAAYGGTQSGSTGDTILIDSAPPVISPYGSFDSILHREEAHLKLDLAAGLVVNQSEAAPYIIGSATISGFTGSGFIINIPFSKPVNVVGSPTLAFDIQGASRAIPLSGGNGTSTLQFEYQAVGADIGATAIDIVDLTPEGSIVAVADNGQIATLTIGQDTVSLPGPITSAGAGGTPPTITSILPSGTTTSASPIVFTVTFSEPVTGFDASDPVVTNGTVAAVAFMAGAQWSVDVTPAGDGPVTIQIPANAVINGGAQANTASAIVTVTSDRTAPAGYAVAWDQAAVNIGNRTATSLSITGAEVGAAYNYSISSSGGGAPVTGSGTVGAAAFNLAGIDVSALADGTLTVSLTLTDIYANAGAAVTDTVVLATVAAGASSLAAPGNATYGLGANLDFTMVLPDPVTVTGTPRLALDANGTNVYAAYNGGTGTDTLTFRYTTGAGQMATPLAFDTTLIDLNGGTITDIGSGNPVNTDFTAVAPVLTGVNVDTVAPTGYAVAILDDPVNGSNETAVDVNLTGLEIGVSYSLTISSNNGGAPVVSSGTVMTATTPLALNFAGLNDGTLTASLTLTDVAGNAGAAVTDTAIKATISVVANVTTPLPLINASPIPFTVTFSEAVTAFNSNDLNIVNGTAAAATTGDNITWSVNVTPTTDGTVSVDAPAAIVVNGFGTPNIASAVTSTTSDRTAPTGQTVNIVPTLVNTAGAAAVDINLAGVEVGADYVLTVTSSGGGAPVVSSGTAAAAGIPLTLNLSGLTDGTLTASLVVTDPATNAAAAVTDTATKTTAAPAITAAAAPANGYYNAPDALSFTVTYGQAVAVTGTPRIALNMGGPTVYADYAGGTGTATLTFTATVGATDNATPLAFASTVIDLNGGTIAGNVSGNPALLDFTGVAPVLTGVFVDNVAPAVTTLAVPNNRVYETGEALFFTVNFSEPMLVTGTPRLTLTYGATTIYATYLSGTGTAALGFSYIVTAGDVAPTGVVLDNQIDLNGGTILDRAGNAAAALTLTPPSLTGVQMNVPSCAGGTVQLGTAYLDGYCAGKITIGITEYDLIVSEPGCAYDPAGNASSEPGSLFNPACGGTDSITKIWASSTGANEGGTNVEDGILNTIQVVTDAARQNPAAAYCYRLDLNGRADWYLPSRNELQVLHQNLGSFGLNGFNSGVYWSSTETASGTANAVDMSTGALTAATKTDANNIRCVRRITPPQIVLNPNPATGKEGIAYSATIAATGGSGSFTFTLVSGTLPPGLSLNGSTGVISGTPTTPGAYSGLVVRASDIYGQSETNPFTIDIEGLPRCNGNTVVSGTAYAGGLCAATVTIGAATYDLVATPSNCGYEAAGTSSTKPSTPFTPTCTGATDTINKRWSNSTAFNDTGSSATNGIMNTLQQRHDPRSQNAASAYCYHMVYGGYDDWYLPARDEVQALYNNMYVNNVGGFALASYWSSTQSGVGDGISVSFTNGIAAGSTKTATSVRIRCVRRVNAPLQIVAPGLPLMDGAVGIAYSHIFTASGGTPGGITYSVAAGTLPPGLALDPNTGVLSGTPTLAGTYAGIVIRATDGSTNTSDTPAQTILVTGLATCNAGAITAGAAYAGGICAGEVTIGAATYDLVATVSNCAFEPAGTATSKPGAEFTPTCNAAADTITKRWADVNGTSEPAASTSDGIGNTQALLGDARRENAAAAYCYHLNSGGYNDWYLPAREELVVLYDNLRANSLGGFAGANYYSSTQTSTTQAYYYNFATLANGGTNKDGAQRVRCVRRANPALGLRMAQTITTVNGSETLAYSMRIPATSSGGAITWSLAAGALPPGLTLNTGTGFITGTPTLAGTYAGIVIEATDGATTLQTSPFSITITTLDACNAGAVPSGDPYGGGLCVGTVTIAAQTFDLVTTLGNCPQDPSGATNTKQTTDYTVACPGTTDGTAKYWATASSLDELTSSTTDGIGNTLQLRTDQRRSNPAAAYCYHLVTGGYSDWYLPSQAELLELYNKVSSKGLGNFASAVYVASTQTATTTARTVHAVTGVQSTITKTNTTPARVRCVRRMDSPLRIAGSPQALSGNEDVPFTFRIFAQGGTGGPYTFSLASGSLPTGIALDGTTGIISGTTTSTGAFAGLSVSVTDGVNTVTTGSFTLNIIARQRCSGAVMAGDAFGGGVCVGQVTIGPSSFDMVAMPSGCGFETSGNTTSKPMATFTPTCSGGTDTMNKRWSSAVGATEGASLVDDGVSNTLQLLSDGQRQNAAAAYCFHLNVGGFSDWYLPSEEELDAVYQGIGRWNLGGVAFGQSYWSSTEQSTDNARSQAFNTLGSLANTSKTTATLRVRCIRRN